MTNPPHGGGTPGPYGQPGQYGPPGSQPPQHPGGHGQPPQPGPYGQPAPGGYGGQPRYGQQPPGVHGPPGQPYGSPPYGQQYGQPYGQPPYGQQFGQPGQQPAHGGQPGHEPGQHPYGGPATPRRSPVRLVLGLVTLGALLALAVVLARVLGDTVLDPSAVERDVAAQFEDREGVAIDLDCPAEMTVEYDAVYECSGTTADGEDVTVEIRITNVVLAEYTWDEI